jgi:protein-disulfide isomerase
MEDKITIKKITLWQAITAILGILLIISIFTKGFTGCPTTAAAIAPTQQKQQEPQEVKRVEVSLDDDPIKGDANAPVTIVEFSDFQCPFCGRFYKQTLPLIEKEYINTGKVKLIFRDFPLNFHENAQKAAEAAECADEQGKFWEYHDKIFENQKKLDMTSLKGYAAEIGLDIEKFDSCIDTGKYSSEVQKDFNDGSRYGVSGTPTFFINGIKLVGAYPFDAFKQIIDAELTK